jgi:hypothetical protein
MQSTFPLLKANKGVTLCNSSLVKVVQLFLIIFLLITSCKSEKWTQNDFKKLTGKERGFVLYGRLQRAVLK